MSLAQCPVDHEFDPYSASYLADPYPLYNRLREESPVLYVPAFDLYLVTRYDDMVAILKDNVTWSASNATALFKQPLPRAKAILDAGYPRVPTFSNSDPPRHGKIRGIASKCLTPRRWAASQPALRSDLEALLDGIDGRDEVDLASEVIVPLTASAGFRLLGFPIEDRDRLLGYCSKRVMLTYGDLSEDEQVDCAHTVVEFWNYCRDFIALRQREPADDLTTDFLKFVGEGEQDLTFGDVTNMVWGIAVASHETTAATMMNGMRDLLSHRDKWDALVADPSLAPRAAEELIRFDPPVVVMRRLAKVDTTVAGFPIPAGKAVAMLFGAGNRDPRQFDAPDTIDLNRTDANKHLTFGHKWHFCLGAPLARFEYALVLERMATRFPQMRIVEDQDPGYLPILLLRMMTRLLVRPGG